MTAVLGTVVKVFKRAVWDAESLSVDRWDENVLAFTRLLSLYFLNRRQQQQGRINVTGFSTPGFTANATESSTPAFTSATGFTANVTGFSTPAFTATSNASASAAANGSQLPLSDMPVIQVMLLTGSISDDQDKSIIVHNLLAGSTTATSSAAASNTSKADISKQSLKGKTKAKATSPAEGTEARIPSAPLAPQPAVLGLGVPVVIRCLYDPSVAVWASDDFVRLVYPGMSLPPSLLNGAAAIQRVCGSNATANGTAESNALKSINAYVDSLLNGTGHAETAMMIAREFDRIIDGVIALGQGYQEHHRSNQHEAIVM